MKITQRRARWFGRIGALVLRMLRATWRLRLSRPLDREDVIYAFHHGDMLMAAATYRHGGVAIMVSHHGDGEVIAQVVERLGFRCVRGSTTRGGARAMLEIVRKCPDIPWAITPDGPRGPRGSVAPGIVLLASKSQRPIVAGAFAVSRAKRLSSWDRFTIPAPFSRIFVAVGEPIEVPPDLEGDAVDGYAERVRSALEALEREAEAALVT